MTRSARDAGRRPRAVFRAARGQAEGNGLERWRRTSESELLNEEEVSCPSLRLHGELRRTCSYEVARRLRFLPGGGRQALISGGR